MEEKRMVINIIGTVIVALVLAAGIYYLRKEKDDPESRKIYGIVSAVGGVLFIVMLVRLILAVC